MQPSSDFHDLTDLRLEQARLLRANSVRSAVPVLFVIVNSSVLLLITGHGLQALFWAVLAALMVAVTVVYPMWFPSPSLNRETAHNYLNGHIAITATTGLVWSLGAIFLMEIDSVTSVIICVLIPCSITLGGLFPSSIYRPGYVALAFAALPPVGLYLVFVGDWNLKFVGSGVLVYFGFGMLSSAKTEMVMRDTLLARLQSTTFSAIAEKNQQVEQLLQENARFVAAISHDLSQPMRATANFVTLLRDTELSPEQASLVDKLDMTRRGQEALFKDLLDHSLEQMYELVPNLEYLQLSDALAATVFEFEALAQLGDIGFQADLGEHAIMSDHKMLNRIVRNLLANAVNYTQAGGWVRLEATLENDEVVLAICDNGPGIPPDEQQRVFEESVRLEAARHQPGTGLGLAISNRLATALNIDLKLHSSLGQGTTVSLRLKKASAQEHPQMVTVLVIGPSHHELYGEWVQLLSSWKMRAIRAANPTEASELLGLLDEAPQFVVVAPEALNEDYDAWEKLAQMAKEMTPAPTLYLEQTDGLSSEMLKELQQAKVHLEVVDERKSSAELRLFLQAGSA